MTPAPPMKVLLVDADAALQARCEAAGLAPTASVDAGAAAAYDAVLWHAPSHDALTALLERTDLPPAAADTAVVVLTAATDDEVEAELLRLGVQAIVAPAPPADLERALRHAVQRKRVERQARTAYATDLATGLPHQAQLLEHMTHLIALRQREPAPMVLLVLRIEGYAQAVARLGGEAGNVLRRKVAVRLRSGLRAGDVVAAIGLEMFGVLLGHLEAKADGERVAAKLVRSLQQPIVVAGQPCAVTASVGLAIHPDHGQHAAGLLRRAVAQAGGIATLGREGLAARAERGDPAANDDAG